MLILAPAGDDASAIEQVLGANGIVPTLCPDGRALLMGMDRGADAAVLTAEGLALTDSPALRRWLAAQPSWADFPFIVLADPHVLHDSPLRDTVDALGNVILLERRVNADTLASAAASALRARARQYQARRHWIDRENDERRLRIALLAANLGAWSTDLVDRRLTASDRLRTHFGLPASGPLTLDSLIDAIAAEDRAGVRDAIEAAFERQADCDVVCRIAQPGAGMRWIQLSGRTIFGDDGRPTMISGVSLDVTDRHQSEQEMQRRVDDAVVQNQRAQAALVQAQKMEAVGQLTGGIAHDFNNLLTAIIGNVDLISRRAPDERIRTMATRARHAADRAARLTGQLLAFSRHQRLDLRPVAIDRMIGDMRDLVARTIGPSITVTAELDAAGRTAIGDRNQLELAVLNLAINARDAMPAGGALTIRTRAERSDPARAETGWLIVAVSDTGIGIAEEILPRVFDPFFTTKPVGKGTGLGLSQVHGVAHQSGGSVKIRSAPGQGTSVEIWLREIRGATVDPGRDAEDEEGLYLGHGHVLVVDDDADVRRFMVECLETLGFAVTQADDGRAGLDRLDQDDPDLLIVDFAMPGMNGADVAAAARGRRPSLPIILATGYAETEKVEAAFAPEAILRKPFRIHELSHAVRRALVRGSRPT